RRHQCSSCGSTAQLVKSSETGHQYALARQSVGEGLTMAKLIYSAITSLDGFVADEDGNFDWAAPDEEVHQFVNDLERPIGTYLFGRRMYEVMTYWETAHEEPGQSPIALDYARIWQAADKTVYSGSLDRVSTARTRLEKTFDADSVRRLKAQARADLSVGG